MKCRLRLNSWSTSSIVGIGYLSCITASLARLTSTQSLTSPFGLGITTTGLIHGVGLSACSIISASSNSCISASTLSRRLKGIRRNG